MIEFENKLPSLVCNGKNNGVFNNREMAFPGIFTTDDPILGEFLHTLRSNIYADRALLFIDGKIIMTNKNWIRDHVHVMKGMRHFEYDLNSFLDFIIETQREDGQFYELIKQVSDGHWKMVDDDCRVMYPDDNLALVRLELEADVEYLVVEGAVYAYKVSGDDEWLKRILPNLEKSIDYMTGNPKRWNKELGLVIRPFTIDTWDFVDTKETHNDRRIHENEPMSAMHGDNSGVYQAMNQLAWFNRRLGNEEKALDWERRAEELKANMFKYLWNGKFFMHQYHIGHNGKDDKENIRLSLSNTYDINRSVTNLEQSRSIIEEYMERRKTTDLFAEWFTIDPPYEPDFASHKAGEYVNGSVSPFTAGELAKAAFNNGYEEYGWDIISRFIKLVERDGMPYFLYHTDSRPQPELGPSAWGAAAFISAVDEGLAGIVDADVGYRKINFSPRFPVTYYTELRYITGYEKTGTKVDVKFILKDEGMRYDIDSPAEEINAHILLPRGKTAKEMYVNGEKTDFVLNSVGESLYANVLVKAKGNISFEIIF